MSKDIQDNSKYVGIAVSQNGYALKYASDALKNNKEIVTLALNQNGDALKHASIEMQNNEDVVLVALKKYHPSLIYASPELQYKLKFLVPVTHYIYSKQEKIDEYINLRAQLGIDLADELIGEMPNKSAAAA
jgi:hypothetical protein